jgi:hypothetical protein
MISKIIDSISLTLNKIIDNILNILGMKKSQVKITKKAANGTKVKATNAIPYPKGTPKGRP